jgi:SAM-dependent methyltransferase
MALTVHASPPVVDRRHHDGTAPSAWIERWTPLIAHGARVLDVACGSGRHVRWFHTRGMQVTGVDIDEAAVAPLRAVARMVVADLEHGPWPLADERFDAIVVTNYLWRPLMPTLAQSLAPNGLLLYETFGNEQARFGKPSNPDFLLKRLELIEATRELRVLAFEDLVLDEPKRHVQRIAARRVSD